MVVKIALDSRELAFLLRQIDEYIQVMEFMIRKTAALDHGELALARNLRAKLGPGKWRPAPKKLNQSFLNPVPLASKIGPCSKLLVRLV